MQIEWVYAGIGLALGLVLAGGFFFRRTVRLERQNAELNAQIRPQREQAEKLSMDLQEARASAVRFETEKQTLTQQMQKNHEDLQKLEARFKDQFENLAHKIFEEKSQAFQKQSHESLTGLLNPLRERMQEFQKKVDESFGVEAKERHSLKEEIKRIVEVNEKMTMQAEGLANALKGDSKVQGDWGEVILENILENSGLRKGEDYIVQGSGLDIKHPESGRSQKPDVVVNLPDDKHVIIDSKVSLTHYERFFAEIDEDQKGAHLKMFLDSVKNHVKELETRRYQDTDKLGTPEIVLMFVPIEGAFMLAIQQDRDLHRFAWDRKVAIVGPSTLFATLKTISSVWRLVRQNQNVQEIARQSGGLYDKIEGFVTDMQILGKQIGTVEKTYENAMKKLSTGQGNIIARTQKLKKLGAKTSKSLPRELLDVDELIDDAAEYINADDDSAQSDEAFLTQEKKSA